MDEAFLARVREVLQEVLDGDYDLYKHSYATCTDDSVINVERGCGRCIALTFVRG